MTFLEETYPQLQIDIEMNSLEDAYIKIAEDEIEAHKARERTENKQSAYIHRTVDLDIFDNMDRKRRDTAYS